MQNVVCQRRHRRRSLHLLRRFNGLCVPLQLGWSPRRLRATTGGGEGRNRDLARWRTLLTDLRGLSGRLDEPQ